MPTKKLSRLLKDARAGQKLSLRALGRKSRVHFVTIQKIESGQSSPSIRTLKRLAVALGLDAAVLLAAA